MDGLNSIAPEQYAYAVALLAIGFALAKLLGKGTERLLQDKVSRHHLILIKRLVFNAVLILFLISALKHMGFELGVLLGAAGILSVALGFASQTSAANLISGLFVIGERSFEVGDLIQVGTTIGEVLSIDLLSVKIRTFDNLFIRIPNETMIKSEVTNLTKFPIRRVDIMVGVAYRENLDRVIEVLKDIANKHILCLDEPEPVTIVTGFGDSSINFRFSFYVEKDHFLKVRNEIYLLIKERFDAENIEIPFPHRTLYTGSVTEPMPVKMVK